MGEKRDTDIRESGSVALSILESVVVVLNHGALLKSGISHHQTDT